MDAVQNLSQTLRKIREYLGLSQVAFSKELGISKSTLQEIEQGHSPTLSTVECISEHLGLPVAFLISDTLPPEQTTRLIHLMRICGWFSQWTQEDQETFLSLAHQITQLIAKYPATMPRPSFGGRSAGEP